MVVAAEQSADSFPGGQPYDLLLVDYELDCPGLDLVGSTPGTPAPAGWSPRLTGGDVIEALAALADDPVRPGLPRLLHPPLAIGISGAGFNNTVMERGGAVASMLKSRFESALLPLVARVLQGRGDAAADSQP